MYSNSDNHMYFHLFSAFQWFGRLVRVVTSLRSNL